MVIKYLGTSAAEGFPAVFCNCEFCRAAREQGEFRTRSQVLFDQTLMVDFPPDSYFHAMAHGVDLSAVSHLLITHSHTDHFYAQEFVNRGYKFASDMREQTLHVYGNAAVKEVFEEGIRREIKEEVLQNIVFHLVKPYRFFRCGEFEVYSLPASHSQNEECMLYFFKKKGKGVLYLNDTGLLQDEVYRYLKQYGLRADLVNLDCTLADQKGPHSGRHMTLAENVKVVNKLRTRGLLSPDAKVVLTHFSHNAAPFRARMDSLAEPHGFIAAYDGMTLEI